MNTFLCNEAVSALISSTSNAEELLETCGVDYWFGGDRTLREACAAAGVDVAPIERQLLPCAREDAPPADESLPALLQELTSHLGDAILPAAVRVREAADKLPKARRGNVLALLSGIEAMLSSHAAIVREHLLPAILPVKVPERTPSHARLSHATVRELAQQHALLAVRVKKLTETSESIAADGAPESAALARAARKLAREVHHHLRIAYSRVMPRLFEAAVVVRSRPERF